VLKRTPPVRHVPRREGSRWILPDEYLAIRAEPRHFAVLPGHVYPEVEVAVGGNDGYVVVQKTGAAEGVTRLLAQAPESR
jgi:hypothetical protein